MIPFKFNITPCIVVMFAIFIVSGISCTKDQMPLSTEYNNKLRDVIRDVKDESSIDYYILPDETDLASIPQDPLNPLTQEKVDLGKLLFYETGLAMDARHESGLKTYSCASCHLPSAGFRPGSIQGVADGGVGIGVNGEGRRKNAEYSEAELDVQSARPISLINVAYVENTMWNGMFGSTGANVGTEHLWTEDSEVHDNHLGMQGIETQNIEGVKIHRITVNKELLDEYGYTAMFDDVFAEVPREDRYTQFTASLAISAYIRTILSNKAPFQQWLKGDDDAMSIQEKQGAILFFGKARCAQCHHNPNLGSDEFHALGVKDMYSNLSYNAFPSDKRNLGRGGFTQKEEDNFTFKVPQVYNTADANFFFHGSSKFTIEEVIDYKIEARSENPFVGNNQLSTKFSPLSLTKDEKEALILFLETSLRDPDLERYAPEEVLSGLCFPNNDLQSTIDLDCN